MSPTVQRLAELLSRQDAKIVLAESCTAGLAAAMLAAIPGISQWLCGSAVVYREATKQRWLGVAANDLLEFSAVSEPVARQMAVGALEQTDEASLSGAITGHLGPDAPSGLDGVAYIATARRSAVGIEVVETSRYKLETHPREARQREATELLLSQVAKLLEN